MVAARDLPHARDWCLGREDSNRWGFLDFPLYFHVLFPCDLSSTVAGSSKGVCREEGSQAGATPPSVSWSWKTRQHCFAVFIGWGSYKRQRGNLGRVLLQGSVRERFTLGQPCNHHPPHGHLNFSWLPRPHALSWSSSRRELQLPARQPLGFFWQRDPGSHERWGRPRWA